MGSLFGGGGNTPPAGAGTTGTPGFGGAAQVFQPQYQPSADWQSNQLLQGMYSQGMNAINALPGWQSPAQAIYPNVTAISAAGTQAVPGVAGAFGSYGGQGVTAASNAAAGYENMLASPYNLLNYNQQAAGALLPALSGAYGAAYNPLYGQTIQNIQANPYLSGAQQGAEAGSWYGATTAQRASDASQAIANLANALPSWGQAAQAKTEQQIPLLQQLAALSGGQAPGALATAQGLSPQLQQLFNQIAPSLTAAGQQFSSQAGATTPELQGIAASGRGLAGAAPGYAQRAGATNLQLQDIAASGRGLAGAAGGYAQAAGAYQPYLNQLVGGAGGAVPTSQALARESAGLAQQFPGQLAGAYAPLAAASGQILNTGFDPQSALYQRTQQQITDQQNAQNALSGVGTSPYGAGVTGEAQRNFAIDWQNQQLARQQQALQSASGVAGMLPGFQQAAQAGLGTAEQQAQQALNPAFSLANQGLASTQAGANMLSNLTQAGGGLGLSAAGQQLANTLGGGNLLTQMTQAGGGLGLSAAGQQLANTQAGANILNSLLQGASGAGTQLTGQQLANLTGGAGAFNQFAQGAGGLAEGAAGLSGQGLQNLLAAYGGSGSLSGQALGLGGGAAGLVGTSAGMPANIYQQQQQNLLNAMGQQTGAAAAGAGALGGLTSALGAAGQQGVGGLTAQAQFGNMPYRTANQQQQNAMNMLTQQMNLGNATYLMPQQVLNDLQAYMTGGQNASSISGQLGNIGAMQQQQQFGNIGSLLGLGSQGLFGSPGAGLTNNAGLLGTGTPGLIGSGGIGPWLGSLFGGSAGAAGTAGTAETLQSLAATVPWAVL